VSDVGFHQHASATLIVEDAQPKWWTMIGKLFKLRIVSLLLFAAMGGAFLGAAGKPSGTELLLLLATGGLSAAGASALNQYIERESDKNMKRTHQRPLANGTIKHSEIVLVIALLMIAVPIILVAPFNFPLAFFLGLGAFIYVVIYTIWLKPRTILNIVIGGAAGSCAVLSGGAAVGAWSEVGVLALAAIVFLWTPTHFWALALMVRDDYERVGTPMLPVLATARESAWWGLIHAIGVAVVVLALGAVPELGWVYFLPALLGTLFFLYQSVRFVQIPERQQALKLFLTSNSYLALILFFVCVGSVVGF